MIPLRLSVLLSVLLATGSACTQIPRSYNVDAHVFSSNREFWYRQ